MLLGNDSCSYLSRWMSDDQLELLVPSLKEGRPNTYTYTKALAEQLLIREAGDLPLAIFRPAIVVAAYQEPFPVSNITHSLTYLPLSAVGMD